MLQLFLQLPELQESKRSRSASPPPPPVVSNTALQGQKSMVTFAVNVCQILWRKCEDPTDLLQIRRRWRIWIKQRPGCERCHSDSTWHEARQRNISQEGKQLSQKYTDRDCKCMARHLLLLSLHWSAAHSEVIVDWFQHGRFFQLRSTPFTTDTQKIPSFDRVPGFKLIEIGRRNRIQNNQTA